MTQRTILPFQYEATTQRGAEQRAHERVRVGGSVRLLLDTPTGITTRVGQIIDLSEGGCAVRVYKRVSAGDSGQIQMEVGGGTLSLPVVVRWARDDNHSWRVGCAFDRAADPKRAFVRDLLERRRQRSGPGGNLREVFG
jgi:PilZ domain-containing protein